MSERLYIVNHTTEEYICIAKEYIQECGYSLGNVDLVDEFLTKTNSLEKLSMIQGTENIPDNYKNINSENKWEIYEKA